MSLDFESMKKDADTLPESSRRRMLASLAEIQRLESEIQVYQRKEEQAKEDRVQQRIRKVKFIGPPVGLFLGYLAISMALETARSGIAHPALPLIVLGLPALALLLYALSLKATSPATPPMLKQPAVRSGGMAPEKSKAILMCVGGASAALF